MNRGDFRLICPCAETGRKSSKDFHSPKASEKLFFQVLGADFVSDIQSFTRDQRTFPVKRGAKVIRIFHLAHLSENNFQRVLPPILLFLITQRTFPRLGLQMYVKISNLKASLEKSSEKSIPLRKSRRGARHLQHLSIVVTMGTQGKLSHVRRHLQGRDGGSEVGEGLSEHLGLNST